MRHCTKYHQNCLYTVAEIQQFIFFQMAAIHHLELVGTYWTPRGDN